MNFAIFSMNSSNYTSSSHWFQFTLLVVENKRSLNDQRRNQKEKKKKQNSMLNWEMFSKYSQ